MQNIQTVLITGASSGIGKELAIIFAKNNYNLILIARSENILHEMSQQLSQQYGVRVTIIVKDLSETDAAKNIYHELQSKNLNIDILVNNAGFGVNGAFYQANLKETLEMISVNMSALTELTHLFLANLVRNKSGKILNVASTAAFQAGPYMAVYSATKAYVLSFSEALAEELKNTGVAVTALCPGPTQTAFGARAKMTHTKLLKNKFGVMDAKTVAQIGYNALQKGERIAICGWLNKCLAFSVRISPRRFTSFLAGYLMR